MKDWWVLDQANFRASLGLFSTMLLFSHLCVSCLTGEYLNVGLEALEPPVPLWIVHNGVR